MSYSGWKLAALALLVALPATAQAQRPSSTMHTRSADLYLQQAAETRVEAERRDNFEKALEQAREGMEAMPENPTPWLQAGQAHAGLGNVLAADSAFDRAEQLWPEYEEEIEGYRISLWAESYNAAIPLYTERDFAAAIEHLERAHAIYQDRPEAMELLAALYAQEGRAEEAERLFRQTLELVSGPLRAEQTPEAQEAWAKIQANVALDFSNLLVSADRLDEAETLYRQLLEANPNDAVVRSNLAVVLTRQGRTDEANAIYTALLDSPDVTTDDAFAIGITLFRGEDYEPAARAFERAAEVNPWAYDALYMLGQSHFFVGQAGQEALEEGASADTAAVIETYERLAEVAERLEEINPLNADILIMRAQAQRGLGDLTSGAASREWKTGALAALERRQALTFEVTEVAITTEDGTTRASGEVLNHAVAAGEPLTFRVAAVDASGNEMGGQAVSVPAPATEQGTTFEASFDVSGTVAGWKITPTGM
ncbi:MAG: tetratricopeptide repeat protein [Gemmatimonadota bacterium]